MLSVSAFIASLLISEVKQQWVWLVCGWGTTDQGTLNTGGLQFITLPTVQQRFYFINKRNRLVLDLTEVPIILSVSSHSIS